MIQIQIPAEMTALCKLSKKQVNDKLQYVYYDKPAGALVATNGHIMLIERLAEPLDAPGGYYEPTAGVYVEDRAGDDWLMWDRVDPKKPGPAVPAGALAAAKAYTRKADADKYKIKLLAVVNDVPYSMDYIKLAAAFVGGAPAGAFYVDDRKESAPVVFDQGPRRALIMPVRYDAEAIAADFLEPTPLDVTTLATKRKAAPVAVYIVITADGGAVAYKTIKDAKEAAWTLQGKVIETVLR